MFRSSTNRTARFTDTATKARRSALLIACGSAVMLGAAAVGSAQPATGGTPVQTQPADANEQAPLRATKLWNLPKRGTLAIQGYDPVAYFPEGGAEPREGKSSITHTHGGVTYRFATRENLELFKKNPAKYEPAFGGWCAWAMSQGSLAEVDPESFIVRDGRLFLFFKSFFSKTRNDWIKGDHNALADRADDNWQDRSEELPREPDPEDLADIRAAEAKAFDR